MLFRSVEVIKSTDFVEFGRCVCGFVVLHKAAHSIIVNYAVKRGEVFWGLQHIAMLCEVLIGEKPQKMTVFKNGNN